MNKKIVLLIISILAFIGSVIFAFSSLRLARSQDENKPIELVPGQEEQYQIMQPYE